MSTFSFAEFTAALPTIEQPLTSIATRLAPHSLTFQEIPDITAFNAATAHIQHIAEALLRGFSEDAARPILRYTQAPLLGYIYEALCDFSVTELSNAAALIEFWQFPKEWLTPLREQLAFLRFAATGTIGEEDVCLADKAWEIAIKLIETFACTSDGHTTTSLGRYPALSLVFTKTTNSFVEQLLGRKPLPKSCIAAEQMEWAKLNRLPQNAARGGLVDLLEHYVKGGLFFHRAECRGAAYEGYYNLVVGGSIVATRTPSRFIYDEEDALASDHFRVLQWLTTRDTVVDNSDGVLGLSLAHRRVRSLALFGNDEEVEHEDVVLFDTVFDGEDEEEEGYDGDDDFDY
jgi:hypothetical protein